PRSTEDPPAPDRKLPECRCLVRSRTSLGGRCPPNARHPSRAARKIGPSPAYSRVSCPSPRGPTMSCIWHAPAGADWRSRALPAGGALAGEEVGLPGVGFLRLGGAERGAALLVRPGVWARVNGAPVLGGMRLLGHKDEVLVGAARAYFSAEATPGVLAFRAAVGGRVPICPTCRGPVRDGSAVVECPGCGRWYHQDGPKTCWTY